MPINLESDSLFGYGLVKRSIISLPAEAARVMGN
jgi:hypothetical protein